MPSDAKRRAWKNFARDLDDCIEWMRDYLDPDDVFSDDELREWARACDPEAVFTEEQLAEWALAAGYESVEMFTDARAAEKSNHEALRGVRAANDLMSRYDDLRTALALLVERWPGRGGEPGPDHYVDAQALENARGALERARESE